MSTLSNTTGGEQWLGPYGNCLLGAFVLHKYVNNPWTDNARFNYALFLNDVEHAVEFMDTVSDMNLDKHPLQEQRDTDRFGKRLGIEFTGLADALAMLGMTYGSPEAVTWLEEILKLKARAEIKHSLNLAKKYGCCPAFEDTEARKRFLNCNYIQNLDLPEDIRKGIQRYGLRNTAWNTVGPTGSISIMSGNCSSGIEPVFMFAYRRATRLSDKQFTFIHRTALEYLINNPDKLAMFETLEDIKKALNYVEASEIDWEDRLRMQAAAQKYTDSSISSTLNLPAEASVELIANIYMRAWELGLKGVTVFRSGCKTGVLTSTEDTEPTDTEPTGAPGYGSVYVKELLDTERAERHRVHWKGAKLYVIVSLDDDDNPVEVFVKIPREAGVNADGVYKEEHYQEKFSLWETITRLTSLLMRSSMPLDKIIKQLDKSTYSLVDASAVLARILRKYLHDENMDGYDDAEIVSMGLGSTCKACGRNAYVHEGGCGVCKACGHSDCG